ncbi:uncharacterized protein N7482_007988 [Penicillium canariense]|uniref:Uncharacterized protein n=1 Tax=Penicillium canariense TaxID=189055 RepID=A0A9W9LKN4_9EURO|nr:uncharacterized protein N7482_007988 [Penicillium canariense]KAJ5160984.1 hypothetical protein N7482_007988 [Penicillium canariense]
MDIPIDPALAEQSKELGATSTAPVIGDDATRAFDEATPPPPSSENCDPIEDPFQPALEVLQRLERDDPKLAAQGARLLSIYGRIWESCQAKRVDVQRLETANQELRSSNTQLCQEGHRLRLQQDDQLARLYAFDQSLDSSRRRLLDILSEWNSRPVSRIANPPEALEELP